MACEANTSIHVAFTYTYLLSSRRLFQYWRSTFTQSAALTCWATYGST